MEINNDGNSVPDLCEKTGLELPPYFMQLPTELKLKIFDSVSGDDVAKVSCVCSELRYLASSDDLWKQKYDAQFGNYENSGSERSFKERFAKDWEGRKKRRHVFDPFGCGADFQAVRAGDHDEWLDIARLCMFGVGGLRLRSS